MAKTDYLELGNGERLQILYEDRAVLAIDKPAGWMLVPFSWQQTARNLQAAITSALATKPFWAKSRNLKYLRYVHRLDADTTGILLLAKTPGALNTFADAFESRRMHKVYLAVVRGVPQEKEWTCQAKIAPDPAQIGRMRIDERNGKVAETHFRFLQKQTRSGGEELSLIEAEPITGRTHQIRIHLLQNETPVWGDVLYGPEAKGPPKRPELGLRAIQLSYFNPFDGRPVEIRAPFRDFARRYGFTLSDPEVARLSRARLLPQQRRTEKAPSERMERTHRNEEE